jgi:hypothetical protein
MVLTSIPSACFELGLATETLLPCFFLRPEDFLTVGESDRTPSRIASGFSPANIGQEGFNALVHRVSPPYRLSA